MRKKILVPTLCRADLGWIFYFGPANFRSIAGEFLSEFWWRILTANFSASFFQGFRPPKKFTPKIHVQSAFLSNFTSWTQNLFTAIFCLRGRPKNPGKLICLSITKAKAKINPQIFICNRFCVDGNIEHFPGSPLAGNGKRPGSRGFKKWSEFCNSSPQGHEAPKTLVLPCFGGNQRRANGPWPISAGFANPWFPGLLCRFSGKEKAHKHKQLLPVTARVGGGGFSRPGGQGSPDRWPGVKSSCAVCGTQVT